LPTFQSEMERGGILGVLSKAPIFVAIAMFAFFWVFFKGKNGGGGSFGNSPLGRLGKIFGGGRKRRNTFGRGGSRDIYGKKDRWDARHGGGSSLGATKQSANMRYGQKQARTSKNAAYNGMGGGFASSGKSYRNSGGFGGGDWSD